MDGGHLKHTVWFPFGLKSQYSRNGKEDLYRKRSIYEQKIESKQLQMIREAVQEKNQTPQEYFQKSQRLKQEVWLGYN